MSTKAALQTKTSPTPVPAIQASAFSATPTRAFTDNIETKEVQDSTSEFQEAVASPPPPEIQLKQATSLGYNFSQISVSGYVPATVQTKLVVGAPGDKYEQEADRMADKVISMDVPAKQPVTQAQPETDEPELQTKPLTKTIQRQEDDDTISLKPLAQTIQRQEDDGTISLKPLSNKISQVVQLKTKQLTANHFESAASNAIARDGDGSFEAGQNIESRLSSQKGSGQALPKSTQQFMESRFGNDFDSVKVHTDNQAVQLSKELGAQAFTHGNDIYFNSGKYNPESNSGKKLLAHELTHTIQQTGPKIKAKSLDTVGKPNKIQLKAETSLIKEIATPVNEKITHLKAEDDTSKTEDNNDNKDNAATGQGEAEAQSGDGADAGASNSDTSTEEAASTAEETSNVGTSAGTDVANNTTAPANTGMGEKADGADASAKTITVPENTEDAPDSSQADPAFQAVIEQSQNVATQYNQHPDPTTKAQEVEQAADDPNQQMRSAQATQVEKTAQQETKPFDRATFEKSLLDKLQLIKPKNLQEADNFNKSGKADQVKGAVKTQVDADKQKSAGGLPAANKDKPKADAEQPKPVTPIPDIGEDVGNQQPPIEADKAVPKEKSEEEIEQPLAQTAENLDNTFGDIQTKLIVGAPGDKYEQEADQMADRVMAMPEPETSKLGESVQNTESVDAAYASSAIQNQTDAAQASQNILPVEEFAGEELLAKAIQRSELVIQRKQSLEPQQVQQPSQEVPLNIERLETWSEVGGSQAIDALKDAKKQSTEGPKEYRQQEEGTLSTAKDEAVATADKTNQEMFDARTQDMNQVATNQQEAKSENEQKRSKISQDIEKIYEETKLAVNTRLQKLDKDVDQEFNRGSQNARQKFEGSVKQKMDAYKKQRYSGILGKGKWLKDKLLGMPDEVNKFYEESKQFYIDEMKKSISAIATIVETGLNEAKALVDKGRKQVNDYVTSLPEDLREAGAGAAAKIQEQFNSLEQSVSNKQNELLDSLTQKYEANLKELDQHIDKLKSENEGLVGKALNLVAKVAGAILKAVLEPVKALFGQYIGDGANKVIDAIIEDPTRFMQNLFKGIGDGLKNFASNIKKHLINGLVSWLFGNLGEFKLPEKFDLKGFLDILLQILGLTKEYIFGLAEQHLGVDIVAVIQFIVENGTDILKTLGQGKEDAGGDEEMVQRAVENDTENEAAEGSSPANSMAEKAQELISGLSGGAKFIFDFFITLVKDGPSAVWEFIKSSIDSLKEMVMAQIQEMIITEVVKAGIIWLISMLNPASGILKIVKAVYDVVSFFIEKKDQIMAFVDSIFSTLTAIVEGGPAIMAAAIEKALSLAIPMVLGFIASLLGLGGFTSKIQKIFKKLKQPIDKLVGGFFKKAKGLFGGKKGGAKKSPSKKGNVKQAKKNKNQNSTKKRTSPKNKAQGVDKQAREPKQVKEKSSDAKSKNKQTKQKPTKGKELWNNARESLGEAFEDFSLDDVVNDADNNEEAENDDEQINRSVETRSFATGQNAFFRQGAYTVQSLPENKLSPRLPAYTSTNTINRTVESPNAFLLQRRHALSQEESNRNIKPMQPPMFSGHTLQRFVEETPPTVGRLFQLKADSNQVNDKGKGLVVNKDRDKN